MRLLVAAADFPPERGGIQRYSGSLALALAEEGHGVTVIAPPDRGSECQDRLQRYAINRPSLGRIWALRLPAFMVSIVRSAKRDHAEAGIATNWYPMGFLLTLVSGLLPMRTVIVCHGLDVTVWRGSPILHRLMLFSLGHADGLVAVSNFTKGLLTGQGIPPDSITVLHPGVVADRPRPRKARHEEVMLTVCRLVYRKGVDAGIRSLLDLRDLPLAYHVAGTGPEARALQSLAEELGITGRFALLGDLTDEELSEAYDTSMVLLLPSRAASVGAGVEGFGMVLLEAQAHGLPVVATRCGGIPEAFVAGKTGILVPPDDSGAVARAVREIDRCRPLGRRMGARGIKWAGRHKWQLVASKMVELTFRESSEPSG
jgi:phosphatidylinositol alpha-1,6-mannosyltransferase